MLQVRFLAGAQVEQTAGTVVPAVCEIVRNPMTHDKLCHMRRMGIDYGSKKVGVALTDESGVMAFPHAVIPNDETFFQTLESLIEKESIQEVVIGQSLNVDGSPNPIQTKIEELITDITLHIGIPVHLEPEQYTSKQAAAVTGKNDMIDASAAAIILDTFIQKQT